MSDFRLTAWQQRVLEVPEEINLALLGGRGGGKTHGMLALSMRYAAENAERARMLFLRQSYAGLRDFELTAQEWLPLGLPGASYNAQNHWWKLPGGGGFELGYLESYSDLNRYQGRSFGLLFVDEAGQFASLDLINRLQANMRGPKGLKIRTVIAANPGGASQTQLCKRFILGKEPWTPFRDDVTGAWWMWCPSTYLDNDAIDQESYRRQLEAACAMDPELLKAWLDGSFVSATGAFFGLVLDERRNAVPPFTEVPKTKWGERWPTWLSHDWGSGAPSATLLLTEAPETQAIDGRVYARGSTIVLDEFVTCRGDDLNKGLQWPVTKVAECILEMCARWKVPATGVCDDACFAELGSSSGSIGTELIRAGVRMQPAQKGKRAHGWEKLRKLMAAAGAPDQPGLYIATNCKYGWGTLPFLYRDPKRVEDMATDGPDHFADALRYAFTRVEYAKSLDLSWAR